MSISTALICVKLFLQLASWFAERADKAEAEKAFADAFKNHFRKSVDAAVDARGDVVSGRVQPDSNDPYRRD